MQVGNISLSVALLAALLAPAPALAAKSSWMPQLEFQTLIAPMSYSEIKNGSQESGFSGQGLHVRAGVDLGLFAVLGYMSVHNQKNTVDTYGLGQEKFDSEIGGLIRADTMESFGLLAGFGNITSKIEISDREEPATTLKGQRVFFGVDYQPCFGMYFCALVEFSATAMGEYTSAKGREFPHRKITTTGYEAAIGFALKY